MSHLSKLKSIHAGLQAFQKNKIESKTNNTAPKKMTAKLIKAAKPAYVPPVKPRPAKPKVAKEFFVTASVKLKFEFTTK